MKPPLGGVCIVGYCWPYKADQKTREGDAVGLSTVSYQYVGYYIRATPRLLRA